MWLRKMEHQSVLLFILIAGLSVWMVDSAKILVVWPQGTKSHQNVYVPLTKELVRRGHHVTVLTNYLNDELTKEKNVRQIWIEELALDITKLFPNMFETMTDRYKKLEMAYGIINMLLNHPPKVTEILFTDQRVQKMMSSESFDLVMISEACGPPCYPFGWHFKVPAIAVSPNAMFPGRAELLGDDEHHSYVPFLLSSFTDRMTLFQRTMNYIIAKTFQFFVHDWHLETITSIFKRTINPDCPSFREIEKNFSLVLINTHPSFTYPRTLPPQVIEVGGLHCRPAKPLPEDLETFVSSSDAGFILFGVGSAIKMDDMPEHVYQSFVKAFSRLPQRVIWQWKGQLRSDLPKNVLAIPWLPQQDLLGHKNCRAFLTHGGLNSLQEAIYHGVPVLGLPFGTDQALNLKRAVRDGYAVTLEWTDVTQETLTKSIQDLLHNPSYKQSAKRLSTLFRDQIQPPLERAVFWTEFVLRHEGTEHLRLGSINLEPYQKALLDVYMVLALFLIIPIVVMFFCVRKCCCRRTVSSEKKKQ